MRTLDRLISQASPDDVCILVYTSGTTGPPKGAMLTHRNLVYAAYIYAEAVGIADKPFEAVCYLPLCHVAERCYCEVMHLVLGGTVSFAESIDTVALNIREIAPTFFVGVPRIYEKLQQGFLFRLGESGRLRQRFVKACFAWGRKLSDRRQNGTDDLARPPRLRAALRPAVPQHPAPSRASPAAVTGSAPARRSRRRRCASSTSSAVRCRRAMD